MLLAQDPKLLLVDEPVAGMTDAETAATAELLKSIAGEHSVVVVEHDMAFVRELGVKVTVLHEGSVLSEGSLDHVQRRSAGNRGLSRAMKALTVSEYRCVLWRGARLTESFDRSRDGKGHLPSRP